MDNEPTETVKPATIRQTTTEDAQRRLRLRVAAKLMGYLAFAGVAYVFISAIMSGDGEVRSVPSLRVDIAELQEGQVQFLTWEGRPVLIYRRSNENVVQLRTADERLADPVSSRSEQPDFAKNDWRSQTPDYFVAIALGTGKGCTVELMPPAAEVFQGVAWQGGFKDSCGEDRYDLAGRVYDNQYAESNLKVPQYAIDGNTVVLGR